MGIKIAIDGPTASGKSTIAKIIANKLGISYLDTGAMYRAVALYSEKNNISPEEIGKYFQKIQIVFDSNGKIFLCNEDVTEEIRDKNISHLASAVFGKNKDVREFLVNMQKEIARCGSVVMDGRDIGTVVMPDADYKFYLVADVEVRAKRRYLDQNNQTYEEILSDLKQRDYTDMHREISPLKKADDAIEIDTTNLSLEQVTDKMMEYIND